jgi:hypothetical protein
MSSVEVVAAKVADVVKLTAGFVAQAAAGLLSKAESLSLEEMSRRLDGALRALRGDEVSTSAGVTTAQKTSLKIDEKTSLQIVQDMVDSYAFDKKTGVSTFTVPAGVTDVDAMKALNVYFWRNTSKFERDAVDKGDLLWYENLPKEYPKYCQERNYSEARPITITGVVKGTTEKDRTTQRGVLEGKSLVLADPRDQALAAAIHACKHNGEDLFKNLWVLGSVPGFAVHTVGWHVLRLHLAGGVIVGKVRDRDVSNLACSGSPSAESKKA